MTPSLPGIRQTLETGFSRTDSSSIYSGGFRVSCRLQLRQFKPTCGRRRVDALWLTWHIETKRTRMEKLWTL